MKASQAFKRKTAVVTLARGGERDGEGREAVVRGECARSCRKVKARDGVAGLERRRTSAWPFGLLFREASSQCVSLRPKVRGPCGEELTRSTHHSALTTVIAQPIILAATVPVVRAVLCFRYGTLSYRSAPSCISREVEAIIENTFRRAALRPSAARRRRPNAASHAPSARHVRRRPSAPRRFDRPARAAAGARCGGLARANLFLMEPNSVKLP